LFKIHFEDSNSVKKDLIGKFKEPTTKTIINTSEAKQLNFFELIKKTNRCLSNSTRIQFVNDYNNNEIKLNTRYIIVDNDNNLLILNLNDNFLYKLNLYGKLINKYDLKIDYIDLKPRGICLNQNGELFVTNISNDKIIKYSSYDYKFMEQFGDDLNGPRGIECHLMKLYICDYNNKRIRIYDNKSLKYVNDIYLDEALHGFFYPFNVKVKFEKIFVTDLTNSIRIFDLNDLNIITKIQDSFIIEPRGLIIDNEARLCVSSRSSSKIYSLYCYNSITGQYLTHITLSAEDVFDILIVKHTYNDDVYFYASLGENGLIKFKMET
jgi:hypothetical protein